MAMAEHAYFRPADTNISKSSSSSFSIDSILGKQSESIEEIQTTDPTHESSIVSPHERFEIESENGSTEAEFENPCPLPKLDLFPPNSFQNNNIRALVPSQNCVSGSVYSPWFSGFRPPSLIFGLQGKSTNK